MGYVKVITYSNLIEVYEYERNLPFRVSKYKQGLAGISAPSEVRTDIRKQVEQKKARQKPNARRSVLAFKRLVSANLGGFQRPVFLTLTYAKNETDLGRARQDFNSFSSYVRDRFGKQIRFVCVPEFQFRGAIHFHTIFWGLPYSITSTEREFRILASMWGHGFVDLKQTDGNIKIATYLAKYMHKAFEDIRLSNKRAWTCSQNMIRPIEDKNTMINPYYYGYRGIELSTATLLHEREFNTYWLGKGRYRLLENKENV